MEVFELRDYSKALVARYSGGIKRRLDIALSLIPNPKILFLDEPTVGLDIESRKALWDMIRKIKQDYGITVFLTTHYLEEADMLSDNICIIKEGHELVQGSPDRLRDYTNRNMIRISLGKLENSSEIIRLLESQPFVKGIRNEEQILFVSVLDCMRDFKIINSILINRDITIESIEVVKPSLDDVFLTILNSVERSA
jgi:ABC-2 type transport system ATP-binding protein